MREIALWIGAVFIFAIFVIGFVTAWLELGTKKGVDCCKDNCDCKDSETKP